MNKVIRMLVLTIFLAVWGTPHSEAASTQVDALIRKLVEKKILSRQEAIELKGEIASDEKQIREESAKVTLPEWVQNTKLKGDFRLRYQYERRKNDQDSRNRARVRYRLGLESQVNDKVKVGAGLASGADDPRSTNQTFQDNFERGDIRLDLAYAEYVHSPQAKVIGGIFSKKDYMWTPSDLLWDTDINPTGGALHLEKKIAGEKVTPYFNSGVLVLDESVSSDMPDPFIDYFQGGIKWQDQKEGNKFDANLAAIYYAFNGVKGVNLDWGSSTNTGRTGCSSSTGACSSGTMFDFDSFGASVELGANRLFGGLPLNIDDRIAVFADAIKNVDSNDDEFGWAAGLVFGHKKVANKGQWQGKYQYSYLGKDAWYDSFPDSDRNGGATDSKGHEFILEYGLNKNVSLGLDYYNDDRIKAAKNRIQLIQADLNFKF
jgi:hypothetical protein